MPEKWPSWLPRVVAESGLIVFSVLLALLLNEWREQKEQDGRVDQALAAIRFELEENQRLVGDALAYHTRIADSFRASAETGSELPDMGVITQGVLAPARVLSTAWESAQGTGTVPEIPYGTVLQLSSVYARQQEYEELSRVIVQTTFDRVLQEGFDSMMRQYPRFVLVQDEFAGRERVLLHAYEDALESLP